MAAKCPSLAYSSNGTQSLFHAKTLLGKAFLKGKNAKKILTTVEEDPFGGCEPPPAGCPKGGGGWLVGEVI